MRKKITKTRSKENVLTNPKKNNVDEKRLSVLKIYSRNTFFSPWKKKFLKLFVFEQLNS